MIRLALVAITGLSLSAAPAVAQSWGGTHDPGYRSGERFSPDPVGYGERPYEGGHGIRRSNAVPSTFDWRGQLGTCTHECAMQDQPCGGGGVACQLWDRVSKACASER